MTTFDLLSSYHGTYLTIFMFSKQNLFGIYSLQYDFLNGYILTFLINVTIGSQVLTNVIGKNPLNCH